MKALLHAGCFKDLVRSMPCASIDLILTDPPYGETSLSWDRWIAEWPAEVYRVLKPTGSMWVFGSMRMFLNRVDEFRQYKFAQDVIWEKHNGSGFHADRFKRVHENALHFYRADSPWKSLYQNVQYTLDATARTVRRKKRPTHMGHIEAGSYTSEDGGPRMMRSVIYVRSEHGRAAPDTKTRSNHRTTDEIFLPAGRNSVRPVHGIGSYRSCSEEERHEFHRGRDQPRLF